MGPDGLLRQPANDTDADTDPLTATLGTGPSHGSFTYTPTAEFSGGDSFTYVASDGTVNSATTTVTLTVTPVNDAPTLDQPAPLTARWDAGAQLVTLTGLSAGGGDADVLTVTALSGAAVDSPVTYAGGTSATFTLTPVVGVQGLVTITVPAFYLTGISPATGPDTGGTNIRVRGSGFLQQATQYAGATRAAVVAPQVLVGGVPVTAVAIESDTVISVFTPALPAGTPLAVQVVVPAGAGGAARGVHAVHQADAASAPDRTDRPDAAAAGSDQPAGPDRCGGRPTRTTRRGKKDTATLAARRWRPATPSVTASPVVRRVPAPTCCSPTRAPQAPRSASRWPSKTARRP